SGFAISPSKLPSLLELLTQRNFSADSTHPHFVIQRADDRLAGSQLRPVQNPHARILRACYSKWCLDFQALPIYEDEVPDPLESSRRSPAKQLGIGGAKCLWANS